MYQLKDMSKAFLCQLAQDIAKELARREEEGDKEPVINASDIKCNNFRFLTPEALRYVMSDARDELERRRWRMETLCRRGKDDRILENMGTDRLYTRNANILLHSGYELFSELFELPPETLISLPRMNIPCLGQTYQMFQYLGLDYFNKWGIMYEDLIKMHKKYKKDQKGGK